MRAAAWLSIVLLGACASAPPAPEAPRADTRPDIQDSAPPPAPPTTDSKPLPRAKPGSLLAKVDRGKLASQIRQAAPPINIKHRCSFQNETGYKGSTRIEIVHNEVKQLATSIEVPLAGGRCDFDSSGFRQTARSPAIELQHPRDGCTVRIWSQGTQLTVSYTRCAARCSTPETFRYVWPVLIDQRKGSCD